SAKNKRPITRLGQEQFASSLFESAFFKLSWFWIPADERGHPFLRHLQMRINPFVLVVEPDLPVALFAPARSAGPDHLLRWIFAQIFPGRRQFDDLLVIDGLPHEIIEKLRPFVPPMAKKLRVIRRKDQWRTIHDFSQMLHLLDSFAEKM